MRGLKHRIGIYSSIHIVASFTDAWIETLLVRQPYFYLLVVPYIGTWIETVLRKSEEFALRVVPYIGTWIETINETTLRNGRTLYRYVD